MAGVRGQTPAARFQQVAQAVQRDRGLATAGWDDCVAALRESKVRTLLVTDPALADRTVWLGSDPSQLAASAPDLRALGAGEPAVFRADEAIPWVAYATGAAIVVPPLDDDDQPVVRPRDDIGALLRHA